MFITLEGMEGAGKSTLALGLAAALEARGRTVCLTREPGGCELGKTLRGILLNTRSSVCAEAELFLFLADRAQHVHEVIRPALAAGSVVICDRFADSTVVYQGYGRGFDTAMLRQLNDAAIGGLWPHKTFVLDLPVQEGLKRARLRNAKDQSAESEGRFEAEAEAFHTRIREGFLHWAAQNAPRCEVICGLQPPETMLEEVLRRLPTTL